MRALYFVEWRRCNGVTVRCCALTTIRSFPDPFAAFACRKWLVYSRTMRITPLASFVLALLMAALLWLAAPSAIGRALRFWEAITVAAAVLALLEGWRGRRLRRAREQTESVRHSALW